MSFQLIGAGSDLASTQTQMNKNILELKNNETTQIFKDDTGTRRVLLGKGNDGFYGLKVSSEGTDVFTAADDELIFNSNQNVFKIYDSGTITVTATAASATYTGEVAFDLPNPPAIIVYVKKPDSNAFHMCPYTNFTGAGTYYQRVISWINDNEVKFQVENSASVTSGDLGDWVFRYYILQETAN